VGGALMSVSTNVEMRLRGRPPSRLPVQNLERFLSIDLDKRQEERLVTVGHVVTSAGFGAARALIAKAPIADRVADGVFAVLAFAPDFVLIPATGGTAPPWRWRPAELGVSALHHGVYATATIAAYRRLERRRRRTEAQPERRLR
jgi:hypothetical protein